MRELTIEEMEQVGGGAFLYGAALGGLAGGVSAYATGGNLGQIAAGVATGAAAGFFGGIAGASSGLTRMLFGAYTIEVGVIGNAANS
jgi:hypothetical protein